MFNKINNANNLLSLLLALVTIGQWLLHIPLNIILLSAVAIIAVWIITILIFFVRRPWHKTMRSEVLKMHSRKYPFKVFYRTVFHQPFYETKYIAPYQSTFMSINNTDRRSVTNKITIIIEDDPVGYAAHRGMVLAFAVEENTTSEQLFKQLKNNKEEILTKRVFFIATPSRRLDAEKSFALSREIGTAIKRFLQVVKEEIRIVSKIDSCLRSNYESEYSGLCDSLGMFSLEILVPAYIEQNRITVHGSQYLTVDNKIIPLHESEFADFKGLEFKNSNIALWLESKSPRIGGRKHIGLVDIDQVRSMKAEDIATRIKERDSSIKAIVIDCSDDNDLTSVSDICAEIEQSGITPFYKFGPSMINRIVQEYLVNEPENKLSSISKDDKGIFIAGSLSTISKLQIENLRDEPSMALVLMSNNEIESNNEGKIVERKCAKIIEKNKRGDNVILTTEFWRSKDNTYPTIAKRDATLHLFAQICRKVKDVNKRWFLFKGSDTALHTIIHGLGISKFYYCGQIIPGVIHCKRSAVEEGVDMKSFFIVGGNVGQKDLLVEFHHYINENATEVRQAD